MSSHPAAHRAPVYEQLAADLQRQGVDTVFGLMSDDTALFVTAPCSALAVAGPRPRMATPSRPLAAA